MKILHVMRTYGAHGGEQQLSQLFSRMNWPIITESFAFIYRDPICAALFSARSPMLVQRVLLDKSFNSSSAWREFFMVLPRLLYLCWRLWRLIQTEKPQICVVHGFQGALVAWPVAMLRRDLRWVYMHRVTKAATKLAFVFRLLYLPYDTLAGNSLSVVSSLRRFSGRTPLITLNNGIDLPLFDTRATAPLSSPLPYATGKVLICVGRLLSQKGHALLIESFAQIASCVPDVSLWIVGEGEERADIESRVSAYQLETRVHLLGYREDVPAILAHSDIFINASSWEGMSNAVLEGMAAGLPSVVVDAPGVTECHINGSTGLVVERDAKQLAEAIMQVLQEEDLGVQLAKAARAHVAKEFSIEANRGRFDALYERLRNSQ